MHSVTYHVDGGMQASRPILLARLLLTPLLLLVQLGFGLWQLLVWPWRALFLCLRTERDTRIWETARRADEFCSSQNAFLLLLSDRWPDGAVRVRLSYTPLVSRLELFIRPLFGILLMFNALVFGMLALSFLAVQYVHVLLTSRRHPLCQRMLLSYLGFLVDMRAYLLLGEEERPPLFPANLGWFLRGKWIHPSPHRL